MGPHPVTLDDGAAVGLRQGVQPTALAAAHLRGSQIYRACSGPPPFSGPYVCTRSGGRNPCTFVGRLVSAPAPRRRRRRRWPAGRRTGSRPPRRPARAGTPRRWPGPARRCSRPSRRRRRPRRPAGVAVEPLPATPLRWKNSIWKSRIRRTSASVSVAATMSGSLATIHSNASSMSKSGGGGSFASRPASRVTTNAAIASTSPKASRPPTSTIGSRYRGRARREPRDVDRPVVGTEGAHDLRLDALDRGVHEHVVDLAVRAVRGEGRPRTARRQPGSRRRRQDPTG